jgi:hypothetical protein
MEMKNPPMAQILVPAASLRYLLVLEQKQINQFLALLLNFRKFSLPNIVFNVKTSLATFTKLRTPITRPFRFIKTPSF